MHCRQVYVTVDLAAVPTLPGAREAAAAGVRSSLHAQNLQVAAQVEDMGDVAQHPTWPLLFDPQTGALLCI